jgi:hypothetical protein
MLINLDIGIEEGELLDSIVSSLDHEQLVEFISNLEALMEDWDVCYDLAIHFMKLLKKMDEEDDPQFHEYGLKQAIKEVMK